MKIVDVLIVNYSDNPLPEYKKVGDAGMDVRANVDNPWVVHPGVTCMIPTGIFIAVPIGWEMQVRPRSGLAIKNSITVLNSPGTIDSGYRGEVKIILYNAGDEVFTVEHGDRIAQLILKESPICEWKVVEKLPESARGEGGFGSTGKE